MKKNKKHRHNWKMEITGHPFAYQILGKKPKMIKLHFCRDEKCGAVADRNKKLL